MDTPDRLRHLLKKSANQKLALQEDLILAVTDRVCQLMEQRGTSRADLAKALGTSRAYVTGLLSGGRNMTLRTLADVLYALGCRTGLSRPFDLAQLLTHFDQEDHSSQLVCLKFEPCPPCLRNRYRVAEELAEEAGISEDKMAI